MHIYKQETPLVEMSPEEAIEYGKRLIEDANLVLRARAKGKAGAYTYRNMCGTVPETGKDAFVRVRIGEY